MEALVVRLFANPQILPYIFSGISELKKGFCTILSYIKKCIYNHKYSLILFTNFFNALSSEEQKLVEELILNGAAKRAPAEFYLEGSSGLRTHVFSCVCNYNWDSQYTIIEELSAVNLPIQVERLGEWVELVYKIDTYSFELTKQYQKEWRKLFKRMKRGSSKK